MQSGHDDLQEEYRDSVIAADTSALVGFAAACAERLAGLARPAMKLADWEFARNVLDGVWVKLADDDGSSGLGNVVNKLGSLAEQYGEIGAPFADDFVTVVSFAASLIESRDSELVWAASHRAYASTDELAARLLSKEGVDFSTHDTRNLLIDHPLVGEELSIQRQDLEAITRGPSDSDISLIRTRSHERSTELEAIMTFSDPGPQPS